MKKILILFILLLSISVFAEPKTINIYTEIPSELRGTWFSLSYSEDQGKTEDQTYQPLFSITSRLISSYYYSDQIISAEKLQFKEGIGYALYSQDNSTVYLVMFYPLTGDTPMVFVFYDNKEQFRSCIKIVKK